MPHTMEAAVGAGEALDSGHLIAGDGHRQGQARVHPASVHDHGAGAALSVIAAHLGPGQAELLAEEIQQGDPRVVGQRVGDPIDPGRREGSFASDRFGERGIRHRPLSSPPSFATGVPRSEHKKSRPCRTGQGIGEPPCIETAG